MLAVFDIYYRTKACNLTVCKILKIRTVHFVYSLMIFVSAHVIITPITAPSIFTNICLVLLLLIADLPVPKFPFQLERKKLGSPGESRT